MRASRLPAVPPPPADLRRHRPIGRGPADRAFGAVPFLLAGVLVSGGCAGAGGGGSLAGGDRSLEPTTEELWSVGGIEAEGWQTFSDRLTIAFDERGRLRIFDALTKKVHLVGADGALERSWGDEGEGPGELASPMGYFAWRDGSSAVFDIGKMGLVRFGPDGDWQEDVRFDPTKGLPGLSGTITDPGGALISTSGGVRIRTSASAADEEPEEPGIPITRFPVDGSDPAVLHRAWEPPEPEGGEQISLGDGSTMNVRLALPRIVAFEPQLHIGVLPDGRLVVADSTTWTLEVISADGQILDTISRPIPPVLVTDEIREAERQRRIRALEATAEGTGGAVVGEMIAIGVVKGAGPMTINTEGMLDAQRSQIDDMLFAEEVPVIGDLTADWDGRVWVERRMVDPEEEGPIDLVSAEGDYLGTILPGGLRTPDAFGPDGLAAYIELDELDVPTVRVVRLRGLGG